MNNFSIPINQTSSHTPNFFHIENFSNAKMGYALEQQKTRETSTSTTTHMRPANTPEMHRAPSNSSIEFVSDADWENRPQRFSSLREKSGTSKMPARRRRRKSDSSSYAYVLSDTPSISRRIPMQRRRYNEGNSENVE